VDAELFARIRRMQDRFEALGRRIVEAYAGGLPEEDLTKIDVLVTREQAY
jgi:hypothetical protein